jgi:hypothetical protein
MKVIQTDNMNEIDLFLNEVNKEIKKEEILDYWFQKKDDYQH